MKMYPNLRHAKHAGLPCMKIRRLRHQLSAFGILRQIINFPVDVNNMGTLLPREMEDYYSFKFHIKRNLIHESIW
jgi:hypothetical protein